MLDMMAEAGGYAACVQGWTDAIDRQRGGRCFAWRRCGDHLPVLGHSDPALESKSFEDCAAVNARARAVGMPHIIETMGARGGLAQNVFDPKFIASHTGVGAEMGADIIKTD